MKINFKINYMDLIENYEKSVNAIVEEFKKKQWPDDEIKGYWIGDFVGEIYDFNGIIYLDFIDILTDIRENVPKGEISKWYDYVNRIYNINNITNVPMLRDVNYHSWLKGCPRIPDSELDAIEKKWSDFRKQVEEVSKTMTDGENKEKEND